MKVTTGTGRLRRWHESSLCKRDVFTICVPGKELQYSCSRALIEVRIYYD